MLGLVGPVYETVAAYHGAVTRGIGTARLACAFALAVALAGCGGSSSAVAVKSTASFCAGLVRSEASFYRAKALYAEAEPVLTHGCLALARRRGLGASITLKQAKALALAFSSGITGSRVSHFSGWKWRRRPVGAGLGFEALSRR